MKLHVNYKIVAMKIVFHVLKVMIFVILAEIDMNYKMMHVPQKVSVV